MLPVITEHIFTVENGASGSCQDWVSKKDLGEKKQSSVPCAWTSKSLFTLGINTSYGNTVFTVLCYRESSGFSKRRISSVSAINTYMDQVDIFLTFFVNKSMTYHVKCIIFRFWKHHGNQSYSLTQCNRKMR